MPSLKRHVSPATVIAVAALFLALNGTSLAGAAVKLVTGAAIKNGTVTGKDIKDASIAATDLTSRTRAALKGRRGNVGRQARRVATAATPRSTASLPAAT